MKILSNHNGQAIIQLETSELANILSMGATFNAIVATRDKIEEHVKISSLMAGDVIKCTDIRNIYTEAAAIVNGASELHRLCTNLKTSASKMQTNLKKYDYHNERHA